MAEERSKLLLVDDDELIRIYFHDVFWLYGLEKRCDLTMVGDLDEAEKVVMDPAKRPDIIFLDLGLPKKVGDRTIIDPQYSFEFLKRIKLNSELKNIKVLIFTAHAEKELQNEAKKCGADAYVRKEENLPKDLLLIITKLLDERKT